MQQGGPIPYAHVAADGHIWADYFFGKGSRCNRVGLLYMHVRLPMATSGPINILQSIANAIGQAL